jgi:FAD/FMN-containing dehydrogenase
VRASDEENVDLLWGIRGGSSNFGILTSFEFRLHPVGPTLLGGLLIHMLDGAHDIVAAYRDYVEAAPEELVTALAVIQAPPAPFVPAQLVGTPVLGIVALYVGDPADGEAVMNGLRRIGPPAMDMVEPMPYTAFQAMLDGFAPEGWRNYNRGVHLSGLPDEAIDCFLTNGEQRLSPMNQAILFRHGGAVARFPKESAAAGHREDAYMAHPIACWQDPAEDAVQIEWAKKFADSLAPFGTGGVYLNFEQNEGAEQVRRGYDADTYARLVALKDKWDPDNLFRVNQNIPPSQAVELPDQRPAAEAAAPQVSDVAESQPG